MGTRAVIGAVLVLAGCAGGDDAMGDEPLTPAEEAGLLAGYELSLEHEAVTWDCDCAAARDSEPHNPGSVFPLNPASFTWLPPAPTCGATIRSAEALTVALCEISTDEYCTCRCFDDATSFSDDFASMACRTRVDDGAAPVKNACAGKTGTQFDSFGESTDCGD